MIPDFFCRGWNAVRVRFWSIGYKKRIVLQGGIVICIALALFLVWTSLFADLTDLDITQKLEGNGSTIWDKWVEEKGLKSIGDIWDGCGEHFNIISYPFDLVELSRKDTQKKYWKSPLEKKENLKVTDSRAAGKLFSFI